MAFGHQVRKAGYQVSPYSKTIEMPRSVPYTFGKLVKCVFQSIVVSPLAHNLPAVSFVFRFLLGLT